jgi:hypothetical protein
MDGSEALMAIADINMVAVYIRNQHARLVVAGFAASTPSLGELWQQLDRALADVPALGSLIARLTAELASQQGRPRLPGGDRHDA